LQAKRANNLTPQGNRGFDFGFWILDFGLVTAAIVILFTPTRLGMFNVPIALMLVG